MISKKCTIILEDEVNCVVGGLSKIHLKHFYETYGFFVKGYFFNPKYKLGRWDGKIRFFSAEGRTFIFLLDAIIPVIVEMEYDVDIVDKRSKKTITPPPIDENYFSHIFDVDSEGPYKLRDYQVNAVNSVLADNGGIVIAGTGAGKTTVNAAVADSYGKHGLKTITIVPSQDLIEQTKEQFEIFELDVGEFSGAVKNPNQLHTVSTWQALQNTPTIMGMFDVVIVDECHGVRGAILKKLLTEHGKHILYRFGLTGTLPEEQVDSMSVKVSLGEVKYTIKAKELMDRDFLAKLDIDIIQLDEDVRDKYLEYVEGCKKLFKKPDSYIAYKNGGHYPEYQDEKSGLQKNEERCKWITTYIAGLADMKKGNVFCLVDGVSFGKKLSKMIPGSIYVHGKDKKEVRKEVYDLFKNNDNIIVFASIGIASTGLNIKRIFNLVFIDIGKSFIRVIQTIGRGLRKAKDKDSVRVTDISSDFKYGKIHLRERIRFYKEAGYPHKKQIVKYNNNLDILDE